MAGMIGGSFVSAVIGKVADMGVSYLVDNYWKQTGVEDELNKLKSSLPRIQAAVEEADRGHEPIEGPLKAWWWQLKDALYAADDVLDDIEYLRLEQQVLSEDTPETSKVRKVCPTFSLSKKEIAILVKPIVLQNPLLEELRNVVKMLHQACVDLDSFAVLTSNEHQRQEKRHIEFMKNRESCSRLAEERVIGRAEVKNNILRWLLESGGEPTTTNNISILSIVGHGGIGKTTLAQCIFNDESVKRSFKHKSWVCVSTDFNVNKLMRKILQSTGGVVPEVDSLEDLQNALEQKLMSFDKFLLVLDDVWNNKNSSDVWDILFAPLIGLNNGSKILLTTRMSEVAQVANKALGRNIVPEAVIHLKGLQKNDFLSLFYRHAFSGENPDSFKKLQLIGEKIAGKLGGSPLAAKVVGGVLNSRMDIRHWEIILDSAISDDILSNLRLSYLHLPEYLRPCFTYCSMFPQDYVFFKDELVHMWMAVGLIQQSVQNQWELLEDIGERYLDELVKRSFLEIIEHNISEGEDSYIMHDLLYAVAQSVSNGECYAFMDDKSVKFIPKTVHHLYFETYDLEMLNKVDIWRNLRSLCLVYRGHCLNEHAQISKEVIESLKSVRVLCVVHVSLPEDFGHLKHLRYLRIVYERDYPLPISLCKLYQIQVIKLEGQFFLPENMNNLVSLRHLLPKSCHSEISGIGKLTSLQKLNFTVKKEIGYSIKELKNLKELRTLKISGLENIGSSKEAREAELCCKERLKMLKLSWRRESPTDHHYSQLDEQLLNCLQPHSNLRRLKIEGYVGFSSPSWFERDIMENIEYIELVKCSKWSSLPSLSDLPYLKYLYLQLMPEVMLLPSLPPSLTELQLTNVGWTVLPTICHNSNIGNNNCSTNTLTAFSSLTTLRIYGCKELTSLQCLRFLPHLTSLSICECPKLVQASIEEEYFTLPVESLGIDEPSLLLMKPLRDFTMVGSLLMWDCTQLQLLTGDIEDWLLQNSKSIYLLELYEASSLQSIPDSFQSLFSLKHLKLTDAHELKSLPQLPFSMQVLEIKGCNSMLKERCQKEGVDRPNIAHIREIIIE